MNIFKRELRIGIKPFLLWTFGLFVLVFAGITKFTGLDASADSVDLSAILDKFPRVVLAVFGAVGIDINTLGGYYSVISYLAMICAIIYAVYLGTNAISRESVDKTYEFLFTKPRSRAYVLKMKFLAGLAYLTLFCVLNYLFSIAAIATLVVSANLNVEILLFGVSVLLVSFMFFALSAFISAIIKQAEKGAMYGNLCFLFVFISGIGYDMLENGGLIKLISPIKYFSPADILNKQLDLWYVAVCVVFTAGLFIGAVVAYRKKDLTAI